MHAMNGKSKLNFSRNEIKSLVSEMEQETCSASEKVLQSVTINDVLASPSLSEVPEAQILNIYQVLEV